ncbi:ABC transporter permease [Roseomonas sp. KE0001]|uniref:ABC transporter permease n=1 Tax=unclassified Roseomonas TaxID=2617492 RepID=UPI0018DEFDB6|nr:ABC transporter permease [Roseomonas sp. KE0001]MBI0434954.1 ABC transporter permease [Roseomonas sp. KE0001]
MMASGSSATLDAPVAARPIRLPRWSVGLFLLLPAVAFLVVFLVIPSLTLLSYSVLTQSAAGDVGLPFSVSGYGRLLLTPAYQRVTVLTLKIALLTSLFTALLAYPLAMVIAYGHSALSRLTMMLVVAPLVVSVVVRTYGWQLLLGSGPNGVVNWALGLFGLGQVSLQILYTEWAVVVASVHVFLPLMVLPIATSLSRISPSLNEAARMLGASAFRAFLRVTLPLSVPGLAVGLTIVFSLTAASYVTPQMLGGPRGLMLGILLEQQVTTVFDWPMGSAIATLMVVIALGAHIGVTWMLNRRRAAVPAAQGEA